MVYAPAELKDLYELRNKLEHRTITHPDGTQELISPKRNKVRQVVVKLYPDALMRILNTYKLKYPN
jgi:UV DNA damage repair endonuclease